jgi:hypothetical protein
LVEAALEGEHSLSLVLIHHCAHLKQTVGGTYALLARGGTTADNNLLIGLLNHLEVVGDDGADLVVACEEVLALPKMMGGLGALVLVGKDCALGNVSYRGGEKNTLENVKGQYFAFSRARRKARKLTHATPDTRTESLDQLSLLLQQRGIDLVQWDTTNAEVV